MGNRKGNKSRLNLSARRKKRTNLQEYNRCRKFDLPYSSRIGKLTDSGTNKSDNSMKDITESNSVLNDTDTNLENSTNDVQDHNEQRNNIFNSMKDITESNSVLNNTDTNPENSTNYVEDHTDPGNNTFNTSANFNVDGRRIIQFEHFFQSLKLISEHGEKFGCTFSNLNIVQEVQQGLNSILNIKCSMCNSTFLVTTNETKNPDMQTVDVNTAAVEGIMSIGAGFYNLEEFLSALEIPCMNKNTYTKYHNIVSDAWEKTAFETMREAARKEAEHAIDIGNVDKNGIPCITVVADACWSKRSYKSNYNALSGAAAIVGHQFGQILYIGIKNKYCAVCNHAKQNNTNVKPHICYKNYDGSSTGMESNILLEGFNSSMDMYGLKYTKMIADGDSSTYKKILDSNPYKDHVVEKIECRNHILRNYSNKLRTISSDTRFPIHLRKLLTARILRLRTAVVSAVKYRKSIDMTTSNKIKYLMEDIDNSLNHVFGDHIKCDNYFCKKKTEENFICDLKKYPEMYNRLLVTVKLVSRHARSLLFDVDSNIVEQFHSIVAKFVGGKRINFAKSRSYQSRCYGAVVSFNTKNRAHYSFHKSIVGKSPSKIKSKFEIKRGEKVKKSLKFKKPARKEICKEDENYGIHCQKPDMDVEEFQREKKIFLQGLITTEQKRKEFEQNTILQSESSVWLEERRKLLTASNFFNVCRRLPTTSCVTLVKNLLYGKDISHVASIKHGKSFEPIALEILQKQINEPIIKCGMFIDNEFPFLAATPDGLVGNDTVVEIKCPYNSQNLSLDELINNKKVTFWKKDKRSNKLCINKHHSWYYQIQGQLRTTRRNKCILAVCTSPTELKTEIITRDDVFWSENMEDKLVKFYMDCLLPELVDSRYKRNMNIRNPSYIEQAIENKKKVKHN